jgi:16S rRNA G966 N2-methylase RsmD
MIKEIYTKEEKQMISRKIKDIDLTIVDDEYNKLVDIGDKSRTISSRTKLGNNIVDYFTFQQRLETKGKYNVSFFEFLANLEEFKKKKFIQTMLTYYANVKNKNNTKNEYKVLKEVYNICISAINIMRPLNCMEIFTKYKAKRVLNFCAGWGGSTIAASVLQLDSHYGVEINTDLKEPYENMIDYLKSKKSNKTNFEMYFSNALDIDYSAMNYETVFVSPPYYFIEKYANNIIYKTKKEMDEQFYKPIFSKTYLHLQQNGYFIINICREVYDNVLKGLLGEAHEVLSLKKSKRQNNYTEMVYVWQKCYNKI